jgi:hypothetical protein
MENKMKILVFGIWRKISDQKLIGAYNAGLFATLR